MRITGQLIDRATGTHLWADRFEGALEDVFLLQDVVAEKVVAALAPSVEQAEIERAKRKPTANLGAYDCYLRGLAIHEVLSRENVDAAAGLFRRALELDPEFSSALGMLLSCYANRRGFGILADAESEKAEVARLVSRALRIGRDDAVALGPTAFAIAYFLRDLTFANEQVSRALTLNPNLASAWANSGWINLWSGNPATAIEHLSRSLRHDPLRVFGGWRSGLSHAHFFLDRYQEALQWAEGFLRAVPDAHAGLRIATASAAFAGMTDEAQKFAGRLIEVDPAFRVSRLEDYLGPYRPREFVEKYKLGLRMAGPARMTEQRRLAAIVSADVAGYSRLMGRRRKRHAGSAESRSSGGRRSGNRAATEAASSRPPAMACCWSSRAWSMRCAARSRCRRRWLTAPPG